eukprot:12888517-Prorocentrum_lima.AAC.1
MQPLVRCSTTSFITWWPWSSTDVDGSRGTAERGGRSSNPRGRPSPGRPAQPVRFRRLAR